MIFEPKTIDDLLVGIKRAVDCNVTVGMAGKLPVLARNLPQLSICIGFRWDSRGLYVVGLRPENNRVCHIVYRVDYERIENPFCTPVG